MRDRRQIKRQKIHKLNTTQKKKQCNNTAKQNYPGLVAFYDTRPGNEVGFILQRSRAHTGHGTEPDRGILFTTILHIWMSLSEQYRLYERLFWDNQWLTLTCAGNSSQSLGLLLLLLLLLLAERATDDHGVLSSRHLHQLIMSSTLRCASAARYVDDVVTWWQKLMKQTQTQANVHLSVQQTKPKYCTQAACNRWIEFLNYYYFYIMKICTTVTSIFQRQTFYTQRHINIFLWIKYWPILWKQKAVNIDSCHLS